MDDIAPELLAKIEQEFQKKFNTDKLLAELSAKLEAGTATHTEAYQYAGRVGTLLTDAYRTNLSTDSLPDGKLWYNIANRVITPTMQNNYSIISRYVTDVQTNLNRAAGIGIKAVEPELNADRISGLVNKVSNADDYKDVEWVLGAPVNTFCQSIVDDSIRENVDFHAKAGLQPKIIRKSSGHCCEWCSAIAGIYTYPDVPEDVYRRHSNCNCTVEYDPRNGKRQNIHTKRWQTKEERDIIEKRKSIGNNSELTPMERATRAEWHLSTMLGHTGTTTKEVLGTIPIEKKEETIQFFNSQIRNKTIEHAIVIDRSGMVVHFTGNENGVGIFDVDLNGAYVSHNHPASNGIISFGEDDFYFLRNNQSMERFFCCNAEFEYSIKVLSPIDNITYNEIWLDAIMKHQPGGELQDEAMQVLADGGYIEYDKRRITGR